LQLEQDEDEQLPHPPPDLDEDADASPEDVPMPKRDMHFLVFELPAGRELGFIREQARRLHLLH
jgi:hypothetical protein